MPPPPPPSTAGRHEAVHVSSVRRRELPVRRLRAAANARDPRQEPSGDRRHHPGKRPRGGVGGHDRRLVATPPGKRSEFYWSLYHHFVKT